MKHLGLFEGIGGFSLAARWMDWETLAWCEWNEFGQKVLKHHFPKAEGFGDITKTDFTKYANRIDILTGGFPCQPYSVAGKREGTEDDRHLWPEMLRAIREIKSPWVVGENVRGLVNWNGGMVFQQVQSDLENEGYEVFPVLLPACGIDAPHRRERIWFIAYSNENGRCRKNARTNERESEIGRIQQQYKMELSKEPINLRELLTNANSERYSIGIQTGFGGIQNQAKTFTGSEFTRKYTENYWSEFPTQSPVCIGHDGLSGKLDGITFPKWRSESIKAAGNAIVPQVAFEIFKAIEQYENLT